MRVRTSSVLTLCGSTSKNMGDYEWPNTVTLDALDYVVDGPIIVQPAEDWSIGIRQGAPEYEHREHAFFNSYQSFEGGIGLKYGSARENPDRFWQSTGVRTWESEREITLGPLVIDGTLPSQPTNGTLGGAFAVHAQGANDDHILYFGMGEKMYKRANDVAWIDDTSTVGSPTDILRLYEWRNPVDNHTTLFAAHGNAAPYTMLYDATWRQTGTGHGSSAQGWSYEWADDFIGFSENILKMYFGEIQMSVDGITWIDVVSVPGSTAFRPFFAGIALNGSGELGPMVVAEGKLWAVDVWTQQREEIDLGMNQTIIAATVWQDGETVVTDGHTVKAYHPDRPVRDMSLIGDHGPGPINNGWIRSFYVVQGRYLLATVELAAGDILQLFLWHGGAWHNVTGDIAGTALDNGTPMVLYNGFLFTNKRNELWIACNNSGIIKTHMIKTDNFRRPLLNAAHEYAASGVLYTTNFDGGFAEVPGCAIEMEIFASKLTAEDETVLVEYSLDGAESYTTLGTFTSSVTRLKWASGAGIAFTSIRFRFTLSRGSTVTKTPVVHAIVFKYLKVPALRRRISFTVNTEMTGRQRSTDKTPEEILDELYALVAATVLKTLTWTGESTYYVKVITMPRTDLTLARVTPAKISHVRVECVEPVEA